MEEKDYQAFADIIEDYRSSLKAGKKPDFEEYVLKYNLGGDFKNFVRENFIIEELLLTTQKLPVKTQASSDAIIASAKKKMKERIAEYNKKMDGVSPHKNIISIFENATTLAANDESTSDCESIKLWLKEEFSSRRIDFGSCQGRLFYKDTESAYLIFELDNKPFSGFDGFTIELSTDDDISVSAIEQDSVVIDFSELKIPIQRYAEVRYIIDDGTKEISRGDFGSIFS